MRHHYRVGCVVEDDSGNAIASLYRDGRRDHILSIVVLPFYHETPIDWNAIELAGYFIQRCPNPHVVQVSGEHGTIIEISPQDLAYLCRQGIFDTIVRHGVDLVSELDTALMGLKRGRFRPI